MKDGALAAKLPRHRVKRPQQRPRSAVEGISYSLRDDEKGVAETNSTRSITSEQRITPSTTSRRSKPGPSALRFPAEVIFAGSCKTVASSDHESPRASQRAQSRRRGPWGSRRAHCPDAPTSEARSLPAWSSASAAE